MHIGASKVGNADTTVNAANRSEASPEMEDKQIQQFAVQAIWTFMKAFFEMKQIKNLFEISFALHAFLAQVRLPPRSPSINIALVALVHQRYASSQHNLMNFIITVERFIASIEAVNLRAPLQWGARPPSSPVELLVLMTNFAAKQDIDDIVNLLGASDVLSQRNVSDGNTPLICASLCALPSAVKVLLAARANLEALNNYGNTAVMAAALKGDADIIQLLVDAGADLKKRSKAGNTVLITAASLNHVDAVRVYAKGGADLEAKNKSGLTPLFMAITESKCSPEIVKTLVQAGARTVAPEAALGGSTALHVAVAAERADVIKALLEAGVDINCVDSVFRTPLMLATEKKLPDMVALLLAAGADVNQPTNRGFIPLMVAADYGDLRLLRMLLDAGANTEYRCHINLTAIGFAIRGHRVSAIQMLFDAGADLHLQCNGKTMLGYARKCGNKDVIKLVETLLALPRTPAQQANARASPTETILQWARVGGPVKELQSLLRLRVDVNCTDARGDTPLLLAVRRGDAAVVDALLAAKASVCVANKRGLNALAMAAVDTNGKGNAVVRRLVQAKADVNGKNKQGKTALMLAAYHGRHASVSALIAAKAKVNMAAACGNTALLLAAQNGSSRVVELLLAAKGDVQLRNKGGDTALLLAARSGSVACARALLDAKSDVKVKNRAKQSALNLAVTQDIAALLRSHNM